MAKCPPYHLDGEFWQIHLEKNVDDETLIGFVPRPLQDPLPEILMPGMNRNSSTMKYAGANGHAPFCHCPVTGNVIADNFRTYEETGEFRTLCLMRYDWDDKSAWLRSMELFAHELMPRLNAKYS